MTALVFPGQASQFVGMGKDFEGSVAAQQLLGQANEIVGFDIAKVMAEGSSEDLKQTKVTQPAVFLHSVIKFLTHVEPIIPKAVAGHSLGEFSALVANGALTFSDGLQLVRARAFAMQHACDAQPGIMAAIVGLEDSIVEQICSQVNGVVVAANYNCPGQIVISGAHEPVAKACDLLTQAGARRAIPLAVGGAFHSPLMKPAQTELSEAIESTSFHQPLCPIFQNVDGKAHSEPDEIKLNLIKQLTSPVRWSDTIQHMVKWGVTDFREVGGSGKVLQGMIKRISRESATATL